MGVSSALLQTKIYRPISRPDLVPRPRLEAILDGCLLPGRKMAVICAPAGSGKTTLVSAWLDRTSRPDEAPDERSHAMVHSPVPDSPTAPTLLPCWLSLDEGDNDIGRFLTYLAASLGQAAPGVGEGALSLLRGQRSPPIESFLTALINDIIDVLPEGMAPTRFLILVVDNYQLVRSQPVYQATEFLLNHLPNQMRLVLISRTEPPLPLSRLRGRGQLLALGGEDLRFTVAEARAYLNQMMGLALELDEVGELAHRTEGWIAGLQMAALALTSQGYHGQGSDGRSKRRGIERFAGSRLIMDYLLEEVVQSQPVELQSFLLQTAILDRLSAPLCDSVTGRADSQAILAELERRNLFILPLDQERRWYRYHHLFAELLRQRLAQTDPAAAAPLLRKASAWHSASGFVAEAIQYALAAGDHDEAAAMIERVAEGAIMNSQFETVRGWLQHLPEEVVAGRPRLSVYQAFLLLLHSGPLAEIEKWLQAAEAHPKRQESAVLAEVILIRAVLALLRGDIAESERLARQAMASLPQDAPLMQSLALRNLGSVYSMTGDAVGAAAALSHAAQVAERMEDKAGLVFALQSLARVSIMQGKLHAARDHLQHALSHGKDSRGRLLPTAARVLMSLGDVKREWNELAEAARLILDGIRMAEQVASFWNLSGYVALARVRQAQGDFDDAQALLDDARELAIRFDATDLDDRLVELYQARLWLAQGKVSLAGRWAARVLHEQPDSAGHLPQPDQMAGWYLVRELEQLLLARIHLAQGQPEEVLSHLEGVLSAARANGRANSVIEIHVLLALTWHALGDQERALGELGEAMLLAEPEAYIRIFLDEGEPMATLLRQVAPDSRYAGYAGQLLSAFPAGPSMTGDAVGARAALSAFPARPSMTDGMDASTHSSFTSPIDLVSNREMDVLRLLPTHLTSSEIGVELSISPNTVRFHIKNIYSKLAVRNRAAAVEQARELGLL